TSVLLAEGRWMRVSQEQSDVDFDLVGFVDAQNSMSCHALASASADYVIARFAYKVAGGAPGPGQPHGSMQFFLPPYASYPNGAKLTLKRVTSICHMLVSVGKSGSMPIFSGFCFVRSRRFEEKRRSFLSG
ncbi:hypothetical protein BaRGS_00006815, partial [Batillaria attramentaria]